MKGKIILIVLFFSGCNLFEKYNRDNPFDRRNINCTFSVSAEFEGPTLVLSWENPPVEVHRYEIYRQKISEYKFPLSPVEPMMEAYSSPVFLTGVVHEQDALYEYAVLAKRSGETVCINDPPILVRQTGQFVPSCSFPVSVTVIGTVPLVLWNELRGADVQFYEVWRRNPDNREIIVERWSDASTTTSDPNCTGWRYCLYDTQGNFSQGATYVYIIKSYDPSSSLINMCSSSPFLYEPLALISCGSRNVFSSPPSSYKRFYIGYEPYRIVINASPSEVWVRGEESVYGYLTEANVHSIVSNISDDFPGLEMTMFYAWSGSSRIDLYTPAGSSSFYSTTLTGNPVDLFASGLYHPDILVFAFDHGSNTYSISSYFYYSGYLNYTASGYPLYLTDVAHLSPLFFAYSSNKELAGFLVFYYSGTAEYLAYDISSSPVQPYWGMTISATYPVIQIGSADLNGSGSIDDVVFLDSNGCLNAFQASNGLWLFSNCFNFSSFILTDVNRDGKADVVAIDSSNQIRAYEGGGAQLFIIPVRGAINQILAADVDGDNYTEIIYISNYETQALDIDLNLNVSPLEWFHAEGASKGAIGFNPITNRGELYLFDGSTTVKCYSIPQGFYKFTSWSWEMEGADPFNRKMVWGSVVP